MLRQAMSFMWIIVASVYVVVTLFRFFSKRSTAETEQALILTFLAIILAFVLM